MRFILSKVLWAFLSPGNALILFLLLGTFLSVARSQKWRQFGHTLSFAAAFLLFLIAIVPVGDWMLLPLENRFPMAIPDRVDGIVVLGGDEKPHISEARDQPVVYESANRYLKFATLARQYPQAKLMFSGGSGLLAPAAGMKDADVVRQILTGIGMPGERIMFEDRSRNTHENAVLAAAMAHPESRQNWLLVTSAWHMPRAIGCFRKAGWNVYPAPADYLSDGKFSTRLQFDASEHLVKVSLAAHEYFGLAAYWFMGYIDRIWP